MAFIFFMDQDYTNIQRYVQLWDEKKHLDKLDGNTLVLYDMIVRYVTSYFNLGDLISNYEVKRCLDGNEFQVFSAIDEKEIIKIHDKYGMKYEVQNEGEESLFSTFDQEREKINKLRADRERQNLGFLVDEEEKGDTDL